MRPTLSAAVATLALAGCRVVDAPDNLEALMVFGFVHLADPPEIQAVADELPGLVRRNRDDIADGYRVDSLTRADLRAAGVAPGPVDAIVGALGTVAYTRDFPDVLDAISHPHKDWIADNTVAYTVLDDTDRACFLRGDCPTYEVTAEQVTSQPILGELTQTFTQQFAWVTHGDRDAVASRILAPDPVDVSSGLFAIDQQYSFFLVRPLPGGGCERTEAMWAEARAIGMDVPDSFAVDAAVGAMGKQAERVDAWIEAGKPRGDGF